MNKIDSHNIFFGMISILLIIIGMLTIILFRVSHKLEKAENLRYKSFILADELKQSSNDLTRYCRTYVITGHNNWEIKYWEVLDIRNGIKPRPNGRTIALLDTMQKLGFTQKELEKLRTSEKNSNDLVWTEKVAFNAMKGLFSDSDKQFTIQKEPDTLLAQRIMFDRKYHIDKARIMAPIAEFYVMLDKRTTKNVNKFKLHKRLLLNSIIVLILLITILSFYAILILRKKVAMKLKQQKQFNLVLEKTIKERTYELDNQNQELIKAKEKTEESEAKFKKLSKLTFEGILLHDKGVVIDMNLSFEKMFGYSCKELLGKNIIDILFPKKHHQIINKSIAKNYTRPFEIEGIRKDSSIFPIEIEAREIKSENKTFRVAAVRDISERKKVEGEIKKLHTAVEQSANSVVITDLEGDIEYTNPKFTEITGYTAQEVLGQNPRILNAGVQSKKYYEVLWQTITAGKTWRGEFQNKAKNGTLFSERATITPIKNKAGKITNFLAIKEDITVQKETKKALKRALVKAKESDKLKSAFLANMSHEIRTPMNGIIGFSEFLLEPNLSEKGRKEYAGVVIECSKQLLKIVNEILDISKIEAGAVQLNYERVNINKQFDDLYTIYKPKAKENNLKFHYEKGLGNNKSIVDIDKTKLNQVLTNLLSNAFKFTKEGSVEFGYQLIGDNLQFYVKDTGEGIEKKLKNKIFDRFFQGNLELNKQYGGTGLGLSISKKFVELFNGEMWYTSSEKGTTIYFTIPYIKKEIPVTSIFIKKEQGEAQVKDKEITILVAEDEEYNMMYINELFSKTNFKMIEAHNGKQAVELFKKHPEIELVLMDLKMPIMNGNEAMKEIKAIKPSIPIIALSAFAMESDKEEALENGFDSYLPKPIDGKLLFSIISKYSD